MDVVSHYFLRAEKGGETINMKEKLVKENPREGVGFE